MTTAWPFSFVIMRPTNLNSLFAPVRSLSGIGPKLAPLFDRLLATQGQEARLIDLLLHLPQPKSTLQFVAIVVA